MKSHLYAIMLVVISALSPTAFAEQAETTPPQNHYFALEPDITTNFITQGDTIGFIRVKVELMVDNMAQLDIVEYHQPLIRDTIIRVLNQENAAKIKSLTGRESIRQLCLAKINAELMPITGQQVVADIFFTSYLYQ